MPETITVIPGDGIGPEVTDATLRLLDEAGAGLEYDRQLAGVTALEKTHDLIPQETLDSIEENCCCLKGPLTTPVGKGFRSVNVQIRKDFDLYANIRPARTILPGGRYDDVDIVLIRENTEGLYVGVEHFIGMEGDARAAAESVMIITRFGAERISRFAFEYARQEGRRKVTLAHKANILKYTQGLFLDVAHEVARDYPEIEWEEGIIDATAMNLVLDPDAFDVLVMENMFGDILSDLMAGLVGGLGFAPAANVGETFSMFEAVHGSAPDIAGQGVANPTAFILAACLLLEHLGKNDPARRIREAVDEVVRSEVRTRDMGGTASTREYTDALIRAL